jgi:hypothetical protein
MNLKNIPFQAINWASLPRTEHKGETGTSYWQTILFPGLRIRVVEYSQNYRANHWCEKGHIVYCLEGEFLSELKNGKITSIPVPEFENTTILSLAVFRDSLLRAPIQR